MKHATVIRHIAFEDLGSFADSMLQQNYTVRYVEAGSDDLTSIDRNTSLLVILGGLIGACDEQDYPFLIDEYGEDAHSNYFCKMPNTLMSSVYPNPCHGFLLSFSQLLRLTTLMRSLN